MEKVIGHLNDCMEASRRDNTWVFVRKDIVEDALALLKEQQEQIDKLIEESASNAEMAEGLKDLLKEKEAEIYKLQKELNYWQYTGIKE